MTDEEKGKQMIENYREGHDKTCPAYLLHMSEDKCECGGAKREYERRRRMQL